MCNPPANRNHRKPGRTVGAAQRPPRLPPAVGRRKKARLAEPEPMHRYTEEPDQLDRSTLAARTGRNKGLQPTEFEDLGRPAGRANS